VQEPRDEPGVEAIARPYAVDDGDRVGRDAHILPIHQSPRASRAAGNALGANPLPIVVPCHRVVHSGGGLGGYTGGLERKVVLLGVEWHAL